MSTPAFTRNFGDSSSRASVIPEFFMDSVIDQAASAAQGRQIWTDLEMVKVIMPGNSLMMPNFKVTDEHRQRWPEHYKAFKEGLEPPTDGTPIEQWPILSKAQVKELRYLEIRTIENMANIPDSTLQRMGMGGMALRDLARSYLDDGQKHQLETKMMHENEALRSQLSAQQQQIDTLNQTLTTLHQQYLATANRPNPLSTMIPGVEALQQSPPVAESSLDKIAKRRGRPPKVQPEAA